jgi:hypothetical protein
MTHALSIPGSSAASDAYLDETGEGLTGLLLPTVNITDGGVFMAAKGNDPGDQDRLPDGSKAKPGIFLAKRTGVLSWKVGYDKKGEDENPAFTVWIKDSEIEDVKLAARAVKARQMKPKDMDATKFDFAVSGVGHLKPLLELLVWLPDTGFTVIAVPPNYHDVVDGIAATKNLVDPKTGEISMAPALFQPDSKPHKSGTWNWDSHFCGLKLITDEAQKAKLLEGFAAYSEIIKENLDLKARVDTWLNCTDRPMTDDIREALRKGIALNPPKF